MTDIIMTVRNPLDTRDMLPVIIKPNDTELAHDWTEALKQEIVRKSHLEKNYCWHGWPNTQRNLQYLCGQINRHIAQINMDLDVGYEHIEYVDHQTVMHPFTGINEDGQRGGGVNHDVMNIVHNHFEHLQGTVENLSEYYKRANPKTKYSMRQLNNLCHEIETLCLSLRKQFYDPQWVRPSQITTFLNAKRHRLTSKHREGFKTNGYDRRFAHVYMHWTQIGKTLMEVYRDEDAPTLDQATCDAITHLQYYSGEFDIEWGRDVLYGKHRWHTEEVDGFREWLKREGYDPEDPSLSLGYLEIGKIDLRRSFGTEDVDKIWEMMGNRLDIYSLSIGDDTAVYDYSWADPDHEERQISYLMPGYMSHV